MVYSTTQLVLNVHHTFSNLIDPRQAPRHSFERWPLYRPAFIPTSTALPAKAFEFLDALKVHHGITSDHELWNTMAWRQSLVSAWRTGRLRISPKHGLRIADELGLPRAYVLACLEAERARDPTVAGVWLEVAKRYRRRAPGDRTAAA